MKTYTASVVGCGSGGGLSLKAYAASDRYDLVGACDLSTDVLVEMEKQYPGIRVYPSHTEMFADCPTDVVSVSTFPPSHRDVTMDALKNALTGILVEKPLGDTSAAGREILAAIRKRRIPVVVPHSWLVRDISQEIKGRILAGDIGELRLMEVLCRRWDIMNAGIHWVHFFLSVIPPEPVNLVMAVCDSSTRTYRDGLQVETMGVTYVQMNSGIRMVMQTGDDTDVPRGGLAFRFYGESGSIEWYLTESRYTIVNPDNPQPTVVDVPARDSRGPHQRYLEHLAEQMDSGVFDFEIPDLSLTALEICEAAYISASKRCRVTFPLEGFSPPEDTGWAPGKPYSGAGGGRDGRKLD